MNRLDPDAVARVSGPRWSTLRPAFIEISDAMLAVSPEATGRLTTIYVKFQFMRGDSVIVYAVAWIKKSSEIVVGLALPD
ncbi:MAG: hypothetical protein IAG10_16750, partial [Planctomycetaceae bacterium]|nr:hypothetical protein [Planctomycetaceae bacterium]